MVWSYMKETLKTPQNSITNKGIQQVVGYKVNIQKSVTFYINNEIFRMEIKKITPCILSAKIIKYLGINLSKEVKIIKH